MDVRALDLRGFLMLQEAEQKRLVRLYGDAVGGRAWLQIRSGRRFKALENDFRFMTWERLLLLRQYVEGGDIVGIIKLLTNMREERIGAVMFLSWLSFKVWIEQRLREVYDLEQTVTNAGGGNVPDYLSAYDYVLNLNRLAKDDITKHEQILKMPYAEVIRQLGYLGAVARWEKEQFEKNK